MKAAHQGLPMADLPGMAGRSYEPSQPQAPSAPQSYAPANPLTSMLSPPQSATPLSREDDARPIIAPPRPPIAVAPTPTPAPRAPAPRPPQMAAAPPKQPVQPPRNIQPPPRVTAAPLPLASAPPSHAPLQTQYPPQRMAAAPASTSGIPRPPGAVGGGVPEAQPAAGNSGGGKFLREPVRTALTWSSVRAASSQRRSASSVRHPRRSGAARCRAC